MKSSISWTECSDPVWYGYNRTDSTVVSTAPIYKFLIDNPHNLKILVYSGDDDSVCGTIGTQKWIWNLGYRTPQIMWAEYLHDSQLAGYFTTWENTNFTFLTIHNAGHEVLIVLFSCCFFTHSCMPYYCRYQLTNLSWRWTCGISI